MILKTLSNHFSAILTFDMNFRPHPTSEALLVCTPNYMYAISALTSPSAGSGPLPPKCRAQSRTVSAPEPGANIVCVEHHGVAMHPGCASHCAGWGGRACETRASQAPASSAQHLTQRLSQELPLLAYVKLPRIPTATSTHPPTR